MKVIEATNVRDALPKAVAYILRNGDEEDTRLGRALVSPTPVTIHYEYPKQHVLVNEIRDANPFFHLIEAMWMLAGRDDGVFLDPYIKDFSKLYSKDGVVMDAYGQRWRHGLGYDQLHDIINQLRKDSMTRQAVLQMWGAGRDDLRAFSMKPCNLVVTFRIQEHQLDMAVFNRSNDLIWGCCGANAVHFPIMQEYVASMIGKEVGEYWQISNNLHLYEKHIISLGDKTGNQTLVEALTTESSCYEPSLALMSYPEHFDEELGEVIKMIEDINKDLPVYTGNTSNTFLSQVVVPMAMAHRSYKKKDMDFAFECINEVIALDWQKAGREWLQRRQQSGCLPLKNNRDKVNER